MLRLPASRRAPAVCLFAIALLLAPTPALGMGLTQQEQLVVDAIAQDEPRAVQLLTALVEVNSGSRNADGIRAVAAMCATELEPLGFLLQEVPGDTIASIGCPHNPDPPVETAPHLIARHIGTSGKRLLLSAHLDTVFEPDSGFLSVTREGDRLFGPGVVDCKGGVAMLVTILRALHWAGVLDEATLTIVLNSDEELGSLTSRPVLEAEAQRHDAAIVFEGGQVQNGATTITTRRKGLGQFRVVVEGRAAHAGVHHDQGANALEEMAGHILSMQAMTDYDTGTTVNVGDVVCPGCKRNIVPGCVEAAVDVRYVRADAGGAIERFFGSLGATPAVRARTDGTPTRTRAAGVLHRPPWTPTPESEALRDLFFRVGDDLGQRLVQRHSGGGSDANLIGARGCPAVDGVGPVGGGFHTHREWLDIPSLTARAQLTAVAIMRLLDQTQPAGTLAPRAPTP